MWWPPVRRSRLHQTAPRNSRTGCSRSDGMFCICICCNLFCMCYSSQSPVMSCHLAIVRANLCEGIVNLIHFGFVSVYWSFAVDLFIRWSCMPHPLCTLHFSSFYSHFDGVKSQLIPSHSSKSCKKDLWAQINTTLQANSK